jgi:HlyD family secretion protein
MLAKVCRIRIGGRPFLLLCAVVLGCIATVGLGRHSAPAETPPAALRLPTISVARAATGTIVDTVLIAGTLVARNEVLVSPEIDGLAIIDLLADAGDTVVRGQELARLARDALDAQLAQNAASIERARATIAQAGSQIAEAEANRTQASSAYDRSRALRDRGNVAPAALEQTQANARIAAARVDAARQAMHLAETDLTLAEAQRRELLVKLSQTSIRATADGVINRRTARLGALASMSGDPLFSIIGDGRIELEADVPETVLARIKAGQTATVRPVGRSDTIKAQVRLIVPEVDATSRLGRVRLALDPVPGLTIGTYARGTIEIERRETTLIPSSAILQAADGAIVQTVHDGIVETRAVTVGLNADSKTEVLDGVKPGEDVIAISGTFVRDGDRVTPAPWCAQPNDNASAAPGSTRPGPTRQDPTRPGTDGTC